MKYLILILCIGFLNISKADTVDYCHVYYNKVKVLECIPNSSVVITIKKKDIKESDSLIIKYFSDTPCFDCIPELEIENDSNKSIFTSKGRGTGSIKVSLIAILKMGDTNTFSVYYYKRNDKNIDNSIALFRIIIE